MSLTVRDYYGVNIVVPTRETLEVLPCLPRDIYGLEQCRVSSVHIVTRLQPIPSPVLAPVIHKLGYYIAPQHHPILRQFALYRSIGKLSTDQHFLP